MFWRFRGGKRPLKKKVDKNDLAEPCAATYSVLVMGRVIHFLISILSQELSIIAI